MKNRVQNLILCILFLLCTIYNKFIITFLVLVVIYFFYFVKLAINSSSSKQSKGGGVKNIKHQIFSREESQISIIFPDNIVSHKIPLFFLNPHFQGPKMIIIFLFFLRLLIFQFHLEHDFQKMGCRQNGQEIDVTIFGSVPQNIKSKTPSFETTHGIFQIKGFLTPEQKNLLLNSSFLTLNGKIQCLGPTAISPFTRESLMIARGNRGVITKIFTLTSTNQPLSTLKTYYNGLFTVPYSPSSDGKTDGILRGILIGDTSNMSPETYQLFIDSGLVHLVSASGGNILILIEIVTALCFFIQIRYRKYLFATVVCMYFFIVGENLSFARAVVAFGLTTFFVPTGYRRNRKTIFFTVLLLFILYNPLIIITSRGLLLSASGVWGLLHIPSHLQHHKILSYILPSFFAYIALLGPLFLLTQHINLISIPLSIITQGLTTAIIFVSPLSLTMFTYVVQVLIDLLFRLAYWGSEYGVFVTTGSYSTIIALAVRILSWLLLHISYTYFHKKHLLSIRD